MYKAEFSPRQVTCPRQKGAVLEQWKEISEFHQYLVSDQGHIRRVEGREVARRKNQTDTVYVGLSRHGKQYARAVALLVAKAFLESGPYSHWDTPINLDGDRWNNCVDNLAWRPRWYARQYHQQFKSRYGNSIERPIHDMSSGEVFDNSWDAAVKNGLLERDIVLAILNRTYTALTFQQFRVEGY